MDNFRFENSRGQTRISEGHVRCVTLLRSNGDLTVVRVLKTLKGSPKTNSTSNPALQKSYDPEFDFLMEQAVEDDEDNVQNRMIKTPLKQTDLVLLLKEVVSAMPKFTLAMAEMPGKTVTYILDVLGKLGQQ